MVPYSRGTTGNTCTMRLQFVEVRGIEPLSKQIFKKRSSIKLGVKIGCINDSTLIFGIKKPPIKGAG